MTNFSVIRLPQSLIITIDKTKQIVCDGCDDATFKRVTKAQSVEELEEILPQISKQFAELKEAELMNEKLKSSKNLVKKGQSVYWKGISELSMPEDLIKEVLKAEEEQNYDALEAYRNFWTLMSLNPDSRCRQNLFWFLQKYGMKISKSGLFVGYRNADIYRGIENYKYSQSLCDFVKESYDKVKAQKRSPKNYFIEILGKDDYYLVNEKTLAYEQMKMSGVELTNLQELYDEFKGVNFKAQNCGGDAVYTDHHSHTFKIRIGELVSMPRKDCDGIQENSCSRGLHVAGASWLEENYFGEQGMVVLVNPAMVVAVPPIDDYGKLRTCEYLPIALCDFDEYGHVIPYNVDNGFDSKYVKTILYDGAKSTEEMPTYVLDAPEIPEINKSAITEQIYEMAKKYINN